MTMTPYHTHSFDVATPAEVAEGVRDDVAVTPASLVSMYADLQDALDRIAALEIALAMRSTGTQDLTGIDNAH